MLPSKVSLFGVTYDNVTKDQALEKTLILLGSNDKANLFFVNADCLHKAQSDQEYRDILNSADLLLPDGIGLKVVSMLFGIKMRDNCNGTDLSPILMRAITKKKYKIFFLGGKEGIAKKAAETMVGCVEGIQIVGAHTGYIDINNEDAVIEEINSSGTDVLFVAMGVPLQEKWIKRNRSKLNVKLCLGVGALLDYLSGTIPRAPLWMRKINMEWFWRIIIDPRRMFKRYVIDGSKFIWFIISKRGIVKSLL